MKKLIIAILISFSFLGSFSSLVHADDTTTVTVTEKIPWLTCKEADNFNAAVDKRKYKCTIEWTFGTVMLMLKGLIKYVAFLAILVAVLLLVVSGVKMSIEWKKEDSKKMFSRVIVSLLVLFSMWLILNTIAPWVYK